MQLLTCRLSCWRPHGELFSNGRICMLHRDTGTLGHVYSHPSRPEYHKRWRCTLRFYRVNMARQIPGPWTCFACPNATCLSMAWHLSGGSTLSLLPPRQHPHSTVLLDGLHSVCNSLHRKTVPPSFSGLQRPCGRKCNRLYTCCSTGLTSNRDKAHAMILVIAFRTRPKRLEPRKFRKL